MKNMKIAIIGLGYVGLPLAVEFAKKYPVVGFDINQSRVSELQAGKDHTLEVDSKLLQNTLVNDIDDLKFRNGFLVSYDISDLQECNFYIITVPTPVDKFNRPILTPLIKASETIGGLSKRRLYYLRKYCLSWGY